MAAGADLGADDPEVAAVYRDLAAKLQVARPAVLASVRAAVARGVRIGAGTDSLGPALRYGPTLPAEVAAFVEAGLTPAEALRTATSSAAEILGLGDRIGRLAAGMSADVLVVDGEPWSRPADLARVALVLRDGRIVFERR